MTEKREKFGCLSKSLVDFLYIKNDEKRKEKYGYDVNKRYERIIKNIDWAFSDIILAFEHLPDSQKEKIDLFSNVENLLNFIEEKQLAKTPDQLLSVTKSNLYAILKAKMYDRHLEELAEADFNKVIKWLQYLSPKNPKTKGADV